VLVPLHERLDVGRRDRAYDVPQLAELTRPVMRPGAGLHRHRTGGLGGEECEHLRPHQALAEHHTAGRVRPVRLENPLRNVQSDRVSLPHGRLLKGSVDTTLARRCRPGASIPSRRFEKLAAAHVAINADAKAAKEWWRCQLAEQGLDTA